MMTSGNARKGDGLRHRNPSIHIGTPSATQGRIMLFTCILNNSKKCSLSLGHCTSSLIWLDGGNIISSLNKSGLLDKVQYCDSNIGLFSIAPHLVIALPTIATAIVVALTRF